MSRAPRDLAASIHRRLLNGARERGEDPQFILQRYAAERFLYRLGISPHREQFVLKGAMLFALWGARPIAATFERRHTNIDAERHTALAPRFYAGAARAEQWRAYLTRNALPGAPADFEQVGEVLQNPRPGLGGFGRGCRVQRQMAAHRSMEHSETDAGAPE